MKYLSIARFVEDLNDADLLSAYPTEGDFGI
jgi:hypothetical protein